jgi:hypothetical protein
MEIRTNEESKGPHDAASDNPMLRPAAIHFGPIYEPTLCNVLLGFWM